MQDNFRPTHVVQGFYSALAQGDLQALVGLMAPDIQWTEAERFPYYGGTWVGPQPVVDNLLAPLSSDWSGFSAKPHEFIADGDRVVVLGEYAGTFHRTSRAMTAPFAHVWTVRDGKLASFSMYTDTAKVLEAIR